MPRADHDLHGNAPDRAPVALLLIDVINDLDFEDGDALLEQARPAALRIAALAAKARRAGIPVIYVNDNFGKWQSDLRNLLEHCTRPTARGREIVTALAPDPDDYFVLKPKHSGFFNTTLELLLDHLHARTLILTGIATNICVLFTANDAYMRDFRLVIPEDCVAAVRPEDGARALDLMRTVLKADTTPSTELDLRALARGERAA